MSPPLASGDAPVNQSRSPSRTQRHATGIAETLALLAAYRGTSGTTRATDSIDVEHLVRRVLGGNPGWKRWAALSNQLPLLAEAAPAAFLEAVKSELRSKSGSIIELFKDHGDTFFSPCLHSGLLWALETLAWHPPYLLPTSLLLAELSERDPGGRWSNRPGNSLTEIFCSWLPHTAEPVDQRIQALRGISEKKPLGGCRLSEPLAGIARALHDHPHTEVARWELDCAPGLRTRFRATGRGLWRPTCRNDRQRSYAVDRHHQAYCRTALHSEDKCVPQTGVPRCVDADP